ncbi:ABC transporter permease [Nonomuraea fuscirosea]|jgi:ABC-2 type transport system permease protein|uniref:Transport permease protein n=1 Tax=Nonomuraea fuscirosea TaxID=1291556 RepID=A0A2T0M5V3_9ACTN|nr:ABC transporter permease [Nonomuraea fuscirosea]PRX52805.1 ABC-2 type transport system permease protein [Nonomuraea fuscirosea]WSA55381.1 ABC transporter permease [Nonomuraea fuscirosea]
MTTLDLTPAPGAAPFGRMVLAQAGAEIRAMLRNGEQLLLTLVIPVLLLTGFSLAPLIDVGGGRRADFLVPGVLALAVMSTAFTGQAIATGFERRYGVLKRLGATPLSRSGLMLAKTTAVVGVEAVQAVIIVAVGLALGWRPQGSFLAAALLIVLGTAAFSGLGLLMAGTLRAEATLAGANLVYLVLLGAGGVMFPLTKFPEGLRPVLEALPISALTGGLRAVLSQGAALPLASVVVLVVWAALSLALVSRTFRWE